MMQLQQAAPAQFKVSVIDDHPCRHISYDRRDFYKITLLAKGHSQLFYASRGIAIHQPALIFTNPQVPCSWEEANEETSGYFCVFTDDFLQTGPPMTSLQQSTLFKAGGDAVYLLDQAQADYVSSIFSRMHLEMESDYVYKYELIRNQVNLIMHEAIKMQPAVAYFTPENAASRITKLFLSLLEKQFPLYSLQDALKLTKAGDYAEQLSIHVNHLNAAVQKITGKSTTTHIHERILAEAEALLAHTSWTVAEISFCLGFQYPSYFNNFFKKHTGVTPMTLRNKATHQ